MDYDIDQTAPEHKSGIAYTPRDDYDTLRHTFEEFISANDERLVALERKRGDVLLEEKVDRINAALDLQTKRMDEMALRQARPALEGRGKMLTDAAAREHKSAFDSYVRSGEAGALRTLETKAMSVGSNPDGGYLVRSNSNARSASGWRRSRQSALSRRCARFPAASTRSRS